MLNIVHQRKHKFFGTIFTLFFFVPFSAIVADSITLIWDQNQEDDLAGYRVYWGVKSLKYDRSEFVGTVTKFAINGLEPGIRYYFAVSALDYCGNESELSTEVSGSIDEGTTESFKFALYPSVPNPFNPRTKIQFCIPERTDIKLEIMNALGQKVCTLFKGTKEPGLYVLFWDGTDDNGRLLSSGVYFCSLTVPQQRISKPITFLH